jgi:hypothetical protein
MKSQFAEEGIMMAKRKKRKKEEKTIKLEENVN